MSDGEGPPPDGDPPAAGQTVVSGEGKPIPKTVDMQPGEAGGKARWWLTTPRTTHIDRHKRQERSVLLMVVLGVVLIVVTVVLLRVLR